MIDAAAITEFTEEEILFLIDNLDKLPPYERLEVQKVLGTLEKRAQQSLAQTKFIPFMQHVEPSMLIGPQHKIIGKLFERIAAGELKRLIINIAPRHSKSTMSSYLFPAWFLGQFPNRKVIMASHTADLAVDFGRKVRNLVGSAVYNEVFPGVVLSADSKAAGRWNTNMGGEYFALGVGGAMAGRGGDLVVIDDPHSEQEAKSGNPAIFDAAYEWYQSGPRQRLQPGGAIVVLMCMTGDTDVLRADGSTTKLRDIRPGDEVATYEFGEITTSRINNWRSSGVDSVYTIKTRSGKILRANERHPFLMEFNGERKWARLRDLIPGMSLVATKAVPDQPEASSNPACVTPAKQETRTTRKILLLHSTHSDTTESGRESSARAENLSIAMDCAKSAIEISTRLRQQLRNSDEQAALSTATVSPLNSMTTWLRNAATAVTRAASRLLQKTRAPIGTASYASTTATTPAKSEDCCATTATSLSGTEKHLKTSNAPLPTYEVIVDEIVSIELTGEEEVFDVEVDRTENFIANGVVSHNTRWNKRDLTGRLIENMVRSPDGDEWEVVELPAIMPSGQPLWPEFWKLEELLAVKASIDNRYWQAQYMQNPVAEEGALVKREWWREWADPEPPECEYVLVTLDAAAETNNRADFTVIAIFGVFQREDEATGEKAANIILLECIRKRMEFPELKDAAYTVVKEWRPDGFIVEKKSAGTQLYQEMRRAGIPVSEYTPTRASGDKQARLNAVADIVRSGLVWYPAGKRWAEEFIDEIQGFPNYGHDDCVDCLAMALARFRNGGFIRVKTDRDMEDEEPFMPRRAAYY